VNCSRIGTEVSLGELFQGKFPGWIPEDFLEILDFIFNNVDALFLQANLHCIGSFEMVLAG
jgi:hypothetical protein